MTEAEAAFQKWWKKNKRKYKKVDESVAHELYCSGFWGGFDLAGKLAIDSLKSVFVGE